MPLLDPEQAAGLIVNSPLVNERQSRRLDIRRELDGTVVVRKIQPVVASLCLAGYPIVRSAQSQPQPRR